MTSDEISGFASLRKAIEDEISQVISRFGEYHIVYDKRWEAYINGLKFALSKIGELEAFLLKQKTLEKAPLERGKQALEFLNWLKHEVETEYPNAIYLSESLDGTIIDLQALIALKDEKKILGDKSA